MLESIKSADGRGVMFLEALAPTLDLAASLRNQGRGAKTLAPGLAWARSIKTHIHKKTWAEVREFLQAHPGRAGIT